MFLFAILLSASAFSLEALLSASLYRRLPASAVSTLRGLSFSISMLPLLLWAGADAFHPLDRPLFCLLLLGALFTICGNISYGFAVRGLPLGIASAIGLSSMTLTVLVCGRFVLMEELGNMHRTAVLLLLLSNVLVASGNSGGAERPVSRRSPILLAVMYGVLGGLGNFCMNIGAQRVHPFVAGYIWDVGAGVIGFLYFTARGRNPFREVSAADCGKILLCCSPAAVGVGAFAVSVTLGPVGLANAFIINGVLIGSSVLAWRYYGEHLKRKQWIGIALVSAAIALVKLA